MFDLLRALYRQWLHLWLFKYDGSFYRTCRRCGSTQKVYLIASGTVFSVGWWMHQKQTTIGCMCARFVHALNYTKDKQP